MIQEISDSRLGYFLTNEFGDKYLYEVNHNSLNKTGAHNLHSLRFSKLIEEQDTLYIINGTDSGTLLKYLDNTEISSGTTIILVEVPEVYQKITTEIDLDALNENILCITLDDFASTLHEINVQSYIYVGKLELHQSLASEHAFLPEYQEMLWTLQAELQQTSWNVESTLGSEPFLVNQLKNVGENLIPSHHLKDSFAGGTAMLLAGGPSLDEILPWVEKNKDRMVILAVSRVCRRLLEIGIKPHMIFSIDPYMVSFDISKEMFSFWQSSIFVNVYHVVPQLLSQWKGKSVFLGARFPWESKLNEESLAHPGPTVSNVALATAVAMGFDQVILAGFDLCFSREGFTHAVGSNEHVAGPQLNNVCKMVKTNGGWEAEATCDFVLGIDILGSQAADAKSKGTTIINPGAHSAQVENIKHMSLDTIELSPLEVNPQEVFDTILPVVDKDYKQDYYKKITKDLAHAYGELLHIRKLSQEAIRCIDGLFGRKGIKQDFKFKKRVDKIENTLNRKHKEFSRLTRSFGIKEFLKLTRIDKDREWEDSEIEDTGRAYYTAYKNSVVTLIDLVQDSKKRVALRQEELKAKPDLLEIAKFWKKDLTPGRAKVWLHENKLNINDLSEDQQKIMQNLLDDFSSMLDMTETDHMKRSRQYAELTGVRGKAISFFRQENKETLQQLVRSLELHPDPEAKFYLYLANGYLLELEGHPGKALELYQKIFDSQNESLIEDCLKRIASISITEGDIANSLLALETLTQVSPTYLIQLAELQRLIGEPQNAIESYLSYIEKAASDTQTMLKLGQLYQEINIPEGAKAMYEHVLQIDKDNQAAKKFLGDL